MNKNENAIEDIFVSEINSLDSGTRDGVATILVADAKIVEARSSKNKYQSVLIQDHTGKIKIFNTNYPNVQLVVGKSYEIYYSISGDLYKPTVFLKSANQINLNASVFAPKNTEFHEDQRKKVMMEDLFNLIIEKIEDINFDSKKIVLTGEKNKKYYLRIWENNECYNLDWQVGNTVHFENIGVSQKDAKSAATLNVYPEFTNIKVLTF